jgi:hypothetical protein
MIEDYYLPPYNVKRFADQQEYELYMIGHRIFQEWRNSCKYLDENKNEYYINKEFYEEKILKQFERFLKFRVKE